jgi:hypothetical protein
MKFILHLMIAVSWTVLDVLDVLVRAGQAAVSGDPPAEVKP